MRDGRTRAGAVLIALVMMGAIMIGSPTAGAAQTGEKKKRDVWTGMDAEISQQSTEGMPISDIINDSVQSGKKIQDVVASSIKVGVDPALVVFTAISQGYAASVVVQSALQAGASLSSVLKSASLAGAASRPAYCGELVTAAIKAGADPSRVVSTACAEGCPDQMVVKTALQAGASLSIVVIAASKAGAEGTSIYAGAADAGASPAEVDRLLKNTGAPGAPVIRNAPVPKEVRSTLAPDPRPVLYGQGGIVLSPGPAWALPTVPADPFPVKINPFLSIEETFSDNVTYTSSDNKQRDSITTVTPGVRLWLPFRSHVAEAELYGVRNTYKTNTDLNITDNHFGLSFDFNISDPFKLRIAGISERGHESLSSSLTGSQEVYRTSDLAASAQYQFNEKIKARLDFAKSSLVFDTSGFRDRDENGIIGDVFYQALPKTSLLLEYGSRKISYSDETLGLDSTTGSLQAGVTWDFSARTKGTLKAGLAKRSYSDSVYPNGTVKVGSAHVRHDFTADTTIVFTAERSIIEPRLQGIAYSITTGGYAELTQRFLEKLTAMVRGAYVDDLYFVRDDKTSLAGAGLKYRPRNWFDISLDYNLRKRKSDIPKYDYTEHATIIMLSGTI